MDVIGLILYYRYILVFILSIIEGPAISILGGLLVRLNYFSFWSLYLVLMAGDLIADMCWYALGYHGARPLVIKYGKCLNITEEALNKTEKVFKEHQIKILFLSKITMGFGFALLVLISAGVSRISFKKFITINFLGQIIWTGFLMSIGYLFGEFYLTLNRDLKIISLTSFIIIILVGLYGLSKYLRKKDMKGELK